MPVGLNVPLGVNAAGGIALVDGDINDAKIIKLALGSDHNENAFQQDIGLGEDMVFDINDPPTRGRIQRRIQALFASFETQKRYALLPRTIKWEVDESQQVLRLEFRYVNLESDQEVLFQTNFIG